MRPNPVPAGFALALSLAAPAAAALPETAVLSAQIEARLACARAPGGIVVGVVGPEGRVVVGAGRAHPEGRPPDGSTLFEVASVSKLFTGLLLADAVSRGELGLEDRLAEHVPLGAAMPKGGASITLLDLATHHSGLPREPSDYRSDRDYSEADGYAMLARSRLESPPGTRTRYSNLGFALLGSAVARAVGSDYATLLRERIAVPLGLRDTTITPGGDQMQRLAVGFSRGGKPMPASVGLHAVPGASEVRTTVDDLLTLVEAAVGLKPSPLTSAFALARQSLRPIDEPPYPDIATGLGVIVDTQDGRPLVYHQGDRRDGFSAFVVFDPERQRGVAMLTNSKRQLGDVAMSVLDAERPAEPCGNPEPAALRVSAAELAAYVGDYRVREGFTVHVLRKGDRLLAFADGPPRELDAIAPDRFYARGQRVTLSFKRDRQGRVEALYFQQFGQYLRGRRVEGG